MKTQIFLTLALVVLAASAHAYGSLQPFDKDFTCVSANDGSALSISYHKDEHPELGWQGGIYWELKTGSNASLAALVQNAGLAVDGTAKVIRRNGLAGQVGNWIQQDKDDLFIAQTKLGFTNWDLIGADGAVIKSASGFISNLKISKSVANGFDGDRLVKHESYLVRLVDDFADILFEFQPGECKIH